MISPSSLLAAIKATPNAGVAKTAEFGIKVAKSTMVSAPICWAAFLAIKSLPSPVTTMGTLALVSFSV